MECFKYEILDNKIIFQIDEEVYPLVCAQKAAGNFLDKAFFAFSRKDNIILVTVIKKEATQSVDLLIGEFYNELLREVIRLNVSRETKNIRELIVGRALYSTCVDTNIDTDSEKEEVLISRGNDSNFDINEIAVNWFGKEGK